MGRRQHAPRAVGNARATLTDTLGGQRGTSLVELLTSVLFVSILSAIAYGFARAALMSARVLEVKSEAQEVTVMALDVLTRDVRGAGFNAAGASFPGVTAAAPTRVDVAADLDGDGTTSGANELIAYSYDATTHTVMRATGGASPQPLVPNVPVGAVHFTFLDAAGTQISTGILTSEERRRIHRIDVTLRVELPNPDLNVTAPLASTVSTSVALRNP